MAAVFFIDIGAFARTRLIRLLVLSCVFAIAVLALPTRAEDSKNLRVIYPREETVNDRRWTYPTAVLRLALERSGRTHLLLASEQSRQQSENLQAIANGDALDVAWSVTSREREQALRPIRIPIDRGLIGWRVLLIQKGSSLRFSDVKTAYDLSLLQGGQGHDWPDLRILRSAGLEVLGSPTYDGLFQMLARGHIDYFPRAISEARDELRARAEIPIELEPTLVLHYPSALYFFVNRDNKPLADALEAGLERAVADGSLRERFDRAYGDDVAAMNLRGRRVLELDNSELPAATPLARKELWFDPSEAPSP